VKTRRFQRLAAASALRQGVKRIRFFLAMVAALTLFAAPVLPSDHRHSPLPPPAVDNIAGEPSGLEKLYQQRAGRNPADAEAFEGMAILQILRGDYADAIAAYRRVLQLTPNDHDAWVGLGRALALSGQFEAALPYFKGLLQQRPGDTDALEGLARMKLWAGHPESALLLFEFLAERYANNPEYAVGLARAQINLHHYPEARTTLTTVLAAHPRYRDGRMELAYLELFEGHQAQALKQFNQLVSEDPTDREALAGR
jgi:tetratricopeptide (TPR) repeat protein